MHIVAIIVFAVMAAVGCMAADDPKISDCPIIRQEDHVLGPGTLRCWHDCNEDGEPDRICLYRWDKKEKIIKTIQCAEVIKDAQKVHETRGGNR